MMVGALAMANTGGTDTGTGTTGTTTDTEVETEAVDTAPYCEDCISASEVAGERGGNPCDDGCNSSGGALPATGLFVVAALLVRRRQD